MSFKLNRRDFLKASAATAGVMAVAGVSESTLTAASAQSAAEAPVQKIRTCCRNCTADCGVIAHVRDGRVIKLEGDPEFERSEGALCPKGLSGIQALYNPNRLKYPMKRVGARGENKFERISWEQAIDEISKKLMEVRAKYGAEAVFGSTGGGGNPNFNGVCRFVDTFDSPNWFEPGACQCYMPRTLAFQMTYGMGVPACPSAGDSHCVEAYFHNDPNWKMKSIVLWATDPCYHGPSQAGRAMAEARAKGVKSVVIDPRFTSDAAKADVWLPVRPGTDVALMLAWIKYIIDKKKYDAEFCLKWTNLPFLVNPKDKTMLRESDIKSGGSSELRVVWDKKSKAAVAMGFPYDEKLNVALDGEYKVKMADGSTVKCKTGFQMLKERCEPWTLKKAAEVCWLPSVDDIEKALKIFVDAPSGMGLGVATDHNEQSYQAAHGCAIINMIMGYVQRPGSLVTHYNDKGVGGIMRTTKYQGMLSNSQLRKRLGGREHKGAMHWWTCPPGYILEAMLNGKPYQLKAWIERSGNKMGTVAETAKWVKAMENLELIVHAYMYPTGFSPYADYLLPLNEWLETDFPTASFNKAFARVACTHLYETINETEMWCRLVKRLAELGHENCKRGRDPEYAKIHCPGEYPYRDTYAQTLDDWCSYLGMTWNEYKSKVPFDITPYDVWRQYYMYKQIDPKTNKPKGFPTPSHVLEVYGENVIIMGRTGAPFAPKDANLLPTDKDYDPLPYFREVTENPNNPDFKGFPLTMTNGRLPVWHHCTLRNIPYLREIFPVAEIWVNPDDASKYGVAQGDWAWVESKRNKIHARVLVTQAIRPGTVYMERFWNAENINAKTHGWQEMNVNALARSEGPYNDVCGTYTIRAYQVKIYKAAGAPEGVWTKPEDFKPWMPTPSYPTPLVKFNDKYEGDK